MLEDVEAVLFDAVGTLIYPQPPVTEVYYKIGKRYASRQSRSEIARTFRQAFSRGEHFRPASEAELDESSAGVSSLDRPPTDNENERCRWKRIVSEVFHDVPHADGPLFASLWDHFAQCGNWSLFDDVAHVWSRLESHKFVLGVASNFDDRLVSICGGIPPLDRCRHLFWSAAIGFPKPSPRFFLDVQRRLGLEPQQILLVGDDLVNDYQGARAVGWTALLLNREADRTTSAEIVPAEHTIRDLTSVATVLARVRPYR